MTLRLRISTYAQASAEMKVRDLHDLELSILPDLWHGLLELVWCASTYAQARVLPCRLQVQCTILDQLPSWAWLYCIRPEQYVHSSHGLL